MENVENWMEMWRIRVGMWNIGMGMQGIRVGMQGIRSGKFPMRGIKVKEKESIFKKI